MGAHCICGMYRESKGLQGRSSICSHSQAGFNEALCGPWWVKVSEQASQLFWLVEIFDTKLHPEGRQLLVE